MSGSEGEDPARILALLINSNNIDVGDPESEAKKAHEGRGVGPLVLTLVRASICSRTRYAQREEFKNEGLDTVQTMKTEESLTASSGSGPLVSTPLVSPGASEKMNIR